MQSKEEKKKDRVTPIRREIPTNAPQPPVAPGEIGQSALAAAALHQLNRCAQEIEAFIEASKMESVIEGIQADLKKCDPAQPPRLRLRRE